MIGKLKCAQLFKTLWYLYHVWQIFFFCLLVKRNCRLKLSRLNWSEDLNKKKMFCMLILFMDFPIIPLNIFLYLNLCFFGFKWSYSDMYNNWGEKINKFSGFIACFLDDFSVFQIWIYVLKLYFLNIKP